MIFDALQASIDELALALSRERVDVASWRPPAAASVEDLFDELRRGESELEVVPLCRRVRIVRLKITDDGGRPLIERRVRHASGRVQDRGRAPAEKMLRDERVAEAVARALREELPVAGALFRILEVGGQPWVEERASSGSFPGLRSVYQIHEAFVRAQGLPAGDFATEEIVASGHRIVHEWTWR